MNILVVEGEDGARAVFTNTLFGKGDQATFANSGEDALALSEKRRLTPLLPTLNYRR